MNILIVGCSEAGRFMARRLQELGQDVAVLDNDSKRLESLNQYGHMPFNGVIYNGVPIDVDSLKNAGINDCDAVLAVTGDDNVNAMVAQVAQQIFKVEHVFACIEDPFLKEVFSEQFSIISVSPTILTSNIIIHLLLGKENSFTVPIGESGLILTTLPISSKQHNTPYGRLRAPQGGMLIGLLHKNGSVTLNPGPDVKLAKDDFIITLAIGQ